jgi:ribonuclease VapC
VIVDSSALTAVLLREPGYEDVLDHLTGAEPVRVGAPTLVETGIVLTARIGLVGKSLLARLLDESGVDVVDLRREHWTVAVDAFVRYGKGRHPAALNFGDCLTYAIARVTAEPLLCVGGDFSQTDLPLVPLR